MNSIVKDRIVAFLSTMGISVREFERRAGLYNGYLTTLKGLPSTASLDKIVGAFPTLSRTWLLTGEGEMLSSDATGTPSTESDDANYKLVPLLNLDSVGGVWSSNEVVDTAEYVESLVPFTDAQDGDIAVFQSGNSMTPTIPPGSLLLLRKVENWQDYIGYGSICVLLLRDGRRITKEIQAYRPDTQNYLLCVSHKEDIAEEPLPKRLIVGVWKVIKVLVNHGW